MEKIEILKLFKTNLIKFLDALIEQFPSETDFIIVRIFLSEQVPIEEVIKIFSSRILPYKQMVLSKDDKFFLNCNDIFEGLGKDKVSYFKNIWISPQITIEDKEQIWRWFKLFVNLTEKYYS